MSRTLAPFASRVSAPAILPSARTVAEALTSQKCPVLLSAKQVVALTSLSRTTIYRLVDEGVFPRPVRIHGSRVGWVEAEVVDWIAARIAERDRVTA